MPSGTLVHPFLGSTGHSKHGSAKVNAEAERQKVVIVNSKERTFISILKTYTEERLGLSKQEIEKMLKDELEKPEAEVDCEIIDMCIEMLVEIDHIKLPDESDIPPPLIHLVRKKGTL